MYSLLHFFADEFKKARDIGIPRAVAVDDRHLSLHVFEGNTEKRVELLEQLADFVEALFNLHEGHILIGLMVLVSLPHAVHRNFQVELLTLHGEFADLLVIIALTVQNTKEYQAASCQCHVRGASKFIRKSSADYITLGLSNSASMDFWVYFYKSFCKLKCKFTIYVFGWVTPTI